MKYSSPNSPELPGKTEASQRQLIAALGWDKCAGVLTNTSNDTGRASRRVPELKEGEYRIGDLQVRLS